MYSCMCIASLEDNVLGLIKSLLTEISLNSKIRFWIVYTVLSTISISLIFMLVAFNMKQVKLPKNSKPGIFTFMKPIYKVLGNFQKFQTSDQPTNRLTDWLRNLDGNSPSQINLHLFGIWGLGICRLVWNFGWDFC